MAQFERAFTVSNIATFSPETCGLSDDASAVLGRFPDFDQFPVKDRSATVGVLERPASGKGLTGTVVSNMTPLAEALITSSDEPIQRLLPAFKHQRYFLVLRGRRITGLVTQSDLVKLPVRLLAFSFVTHLERLMTKLITAAYPEEHQWVSRLPAKRREKMEQKLSWLRADRLDPPLIELIDYGDKRRLVGQALSMSADFDSEVKEVEKLRNQVAHAASYADDEEQLPVFLDRLNLAAKWIDGLQKRNGETAASELAT